MKVSQSRKIWYEVISTVNKKPRQFHKIKSKKEVTLKTRENLKNQKLRKMFFEISFQKVYWKLSFSRYVA